MLVVNIPLLLHLDFFNNTLLNNKRNVVPQKLLHY